MNDGALWPATLVPSIARWQNSRVTAHAVVIAVAGLARLLVAWLALGIAAATALVLPQTAFSSSVIEAPLRALGIVAGAGMLVAGALTWLDRIAMARGGLAIVAGLAFVAPAWEAWEGAPVIVRSIAAFVWPFFLPAIAHIVLATPTGRLDRQLVRAGVAAGYLAATATAFAMALLRHPFLDPHAGAVAGTTCCSSAHSRTSSAPRYLASPSCRSWSGRP